MGAKQLDPLPRDAATQRPSSVDDLQHAAEHRVTSQAITTLTAQMAEFAVRAAERDTVMRDASRRLKAVEENLGQNTAMTSELLDLFMAVKGGFKVLGWLAAFAKWMAAFVGAGTAIWAGWHTFNK